MRDAMFLDLDLKAILIVIAASTLLSELLEGWTYLWAITFVAAIHVYRLDLTDRVTVLAAIVLAGIVVHDLTVWDERYLAEASEEELDRLERVQQRRMRSPSWYVVWGVMVKVAWAPYGHMLLVWWAGMAWLVAFQVVGAQRAKRAIARVRPDHAGVPATTFPT